MRRDPGQDLLGRGLLELPLLTCLAEGLLERGDHGVGGRLAAGAQDDVDAGLGRHLGDARTP